MGLEGKVRSLFVISSLAISFISCNRAEYITPIPLPSNTPTYTPTVFQHMPITPTPTNTPLPTLTYTPTPTSTPLSTGKKIVVDLSDQMIFAYSVYPHTEVLEYEALVSTGTAEHPTVIGKFKIWIKLESTRMTGFYQGYGIHGTYWHDNFGTPMSHGCVNLRNDDAKWFFEFSEVGTPVIVRE